MKKPAKTTKKKAPTSKSPAKKKTLKVLKTDEELDKASGGVIKPCWSWINQE